MSRQVVCHFYYTELMHLFPPLLSVANVVCSCQCFAALFYSSKSYETFPLAVLTILNQLLLRTSFRQELFNSLSVAVHQSKAVNALTSEIYCIWQQRVPIFHGVPKHLWTDKLEEEQCYTIQINLNDSGFSYLFVCIGARGFFFKSFQCSAGLFIQ